MLRVPIVALASAAALLCLAARAQLAPQPAAITAAHAATGASPAPLDAVADAQTELQTGSRLTREGFLQDAIPHLLAARRKGIAPYATGINLAICYQGTGQYKSAVEILRELEASGTATATVYNLLAQAYLGNRQQREAWQSFLLAAAATPKDEKLYAFMADACTDQGDDSLGLTIVNRGLGELPDSARLHYERAVFLARLGSLEEARPEFDRAADLAPDGYIGYLAKVQKALYDDDFAKADTILHQAIRAGHSDFRMLSLLGTVLLHEGVAPGEPRFAEAQAALEKSAQERPDYSATQIALGKVYLMENQPRQAIEHLEIGRRLEPDNPAVYATLASAWEKLGDREKAVAMRRQIGRLLAQKAANGASAKP
ncbi:MAG TPA: tetratricopeptide repeat protein [Terracidiphilus sp.]|nr:tetratricopeptide repeat protein [Terracidiphilus sp.]